MVSPRTTFVGRKEEIQSFEHLVHQDEQECAVLYLEAEGGLGKTKLLEQFRSRCATLGKAHSQIIDFYETTNQLVVGLMERIADEVKKALPSTGLDQTTISPFASFDDTVRQLRLAQQSGQDFDRIAQLRREVEDTFLEDYNGVAGALPRRMIPIVLFFDTFEYIPEFGEVSAFLLSQFIANVRDTFCVIAGRTKLPADLGPNVTVLRVQPFSIEEIREYFDHAQIAAANLDANLDHLQQLTRGNPLLITLVAGWVLKHPDQSLEDLLGREPQIDKNVQDRFKQRLIGDIVRLDLPNEYEAVWYMAHVYQRFDADVLSWLTGQSPDEATAVIANLRHFPFVKYRASSASYQLQDVMRDLVREYVLDQVEDRDKSLRRDLSSRTIAYYDRKIASAKAKGHTHEVQVFQAEKLYHQFYLDISSAFDVFDQLYQEADRRSLTSVSDLLLANANQYSKQFTPGQRLVFEIYSGWLNKDLGRYSTAEQLLLVPVESLRREQSPRFAEVANSLGYVYKQLGRYADALDLYKEALAANQRLRGTPDWQDALAPMILNNMGNIFRLQGLVDDAHVYSMRSLILRQQLPTTRNQSLALGNSCYVLGQILREFGDNTGALRYFERAESYYHDPRLGRDGRIGVANVIRQRAYVYNHVREHARAIGLAAKALSVLQEERLPACYDLADAFDILGRLYRDQAYDDYVRERVGDEEAARQNRDEQLAKAEDFISRGYSVAVKARDQFKQAESILSYVRLYSILGDYKKALDYYDRGVALSKPLNYYLLLSYFESFAGSAYFQLKDYDRAFERFAWRVMYAAHCRAMELGMAMDSIGTYLTRLGEPALITRYADFLVGLWRQHPDEKLAQRYPQIIELCQAIKVDLSQ